MRISLPDLCPRARIVSMWKYCRHPVAKLSNRDRLVDPRASFRSPPDFGIPRKSYDDFSHLLVMTYCARIPPERSIPLVGDRLFAPQQGVQKDTRLALSGSKPGPLDPLQVFLRGKMNEKHFLASYPAFGNPRRYIPPGKLPAERDSGFLSPSYFLQSTEKLVPLQVRHLPSFRSDWHHRGPRLPSEFPVVNVPLAKIGLNGNLAYTEVCKLLNLPGEFQSPKLSRWSVFHVWSVYRSGKSSLISVAMIARSAALKFQILPPAVSPPKPAYAGADSTKPRSANHSLKTNLQHSDNQTQLNG